MDTPDLIIPVRMDVDKAIKQLQKIGPAGKKAGDDVEGAAKKGRKSLDDMGGGADSATKLLLALGRSQMAMQAISTVGAAISSEFKRAADYCKNLAMEFSELRQMMQQVAALKGQPNTDEFAVAEAQKAKAASLMPQEWRQFQEPFQSYGGAYIEGEQNRFVEREIEDKDGKKKTISAQKQAEQYQQNLAEFAKARGIPPTEIAQLGGALLQFSEGPQTNEELMSRLGKVYKTLERAPTPVAELMPAMSRVMAQGASPEEASRMLAVMSEAMPHEEETGVINTLKAITNETLEGKGAALGQEKGMTPLQKVEAAVKAIKDRVDKGEDLDKLIHDIAPDLREAKGIKGFLTRGLEAQGFERTLGYQEQTSADFVQTTLKDYEQTDAGQKARRDADEALARAERGAQHQDVEAVLQRARTEVTRSGELEEGRLANLGHQATGWWSGVEVDQQKINTEAIEELKRQGRLEMERQGKNPALVPELSSSAASETFGHGAKSQYMVNEEIRNLLKIIAENTGKDLAKEPARYRTGEFAERAKGEPGKPLAALPPGGAGVRQ